jgi:integrase/recombinase XerD
MVLEFTVCELRWERYPQVSENRHAKQWLEFQAARGLAANTLDAYGRDLDRYVSFLEGAAIPLEVVNRSTLACYLRNSSGRSD